MAVSNFFTKAVNGLDYISWEIVIIACLTIGLAPFIPEPHVLEKLKMLWAGTLHKPIDIFDLFMHGTPFILLILKGIRLALISQDKQQS